MIKISRLLSIVEWVLVQILIITYFMLRAIHAPLGAFRLNKRLLAESKAPMLCG
jgi:hypothetical protein